MSFGLDFFVSGDFWQGLGPYFNIGGMNTEDILSRVSIMPNQPTRPCSAVLDFNSCLKKFQLIAMENDRCSNFITGL